MQTWVLAVAVSVALLALLPCAAAEAAPAADGGAQQAEAPSEPLSADAVFARAEAEDASGDYAHAAAHYRQAVALLPSFRYASKAITRAALLEAHSEGGWAPFAQLEAVRSDPKATDDPEAIDALARRIDAFPPGPTRSEAWMVCAEAYIARLHRRSDGEAALRKVIDDPRADGLLRRQAASQLVTAMIDDGDLTAARTTAASLGHTLDPKLAQRVDVLLRRRRMHVASIADLAVFAVLAAWAIARAASRGALHDAREALRKMAPLVLVFAAYVAIAGGALASGYESGNAAPFFAFGVALVPVMTMARAWGAAGSAATIARAGRAAVSGSAVVAAAFLVLEAINGQYLEGFKL